MRDFGVSNGSEWFFQRLGEWGKPMIPTVYKGI